jgi:hypothetical protein
VGAAPAVACHDGQLEARIALALKEQCQLAECQTVAGRDRKPGNERLVPALHATPFAKHAADWIGAIEHHDLDAAWLTGRHSGVHGGGERVVAAADVGKVYHDDPNVVEVL